MYHQQQSIQVHIGEWDILHNKFIEAMGIRSWVIINLAGPNLRTRNGPRPTHPYARDFMQVISQHCQARGEFR